MALLSLGLAMSRRRPTQKEIDAARERLGYPAMPPPDDEDEDDGEQTQEKGHLKIGAKQAVAVAVFFAACLGSVWATTISSRDKVVQEHITASSNRARDEAAARARLEERQGAAERRLEDHEGRLRTTERERAEILYIVREMGRRDGIRAPRELVEPSPSPAP